MSTNYPTSKQTFTDPSSSDNLNSPSHSGLHTDMNDTMEAVQDKLGTAASNNAPAANKFLRGTGANTSEWDIDFKDEDDMSSNSATALSSQQSIKAYVDLLTKSSQDGFMINGKIAATVSSNNLTVAIKTLGGGDPSASDPVTVMINGTPRTITSALSVTKNAATNWFNAGSSELATKEIDYFVYLGYNATDGVVIGFARYPGAKKYGDFSTTTTNEKYCAISTITNAASTDYYEVIGRFAATLSAGAGYTWSVPTFTASNLIQRPVRETRWLNWTPTYAATGSMTYTSVTEATNVYKLECDKLVAILLSTGTTGGTANTTITASMPFNSANVYDTHAGRITDATAKACQVFNGNDATNISWRLVDGSNWSLGTGRQIWGKIICQI